MKWKLTYDKGDNSRAPEQTKYRLNCSLLCYIIELGSG